MSYRQTCVYEIYADPNVWNISHRIYKITTENNIVLRCLLQILKLNVETVAKISTLQILLKSVSRYGFVERTVQTAVSHYANIIFCFLFLFSSFFHLKNLNKT